MRHICQRDKYEKVFLSISLSCNANGSGSMRVLSTMLLLLLAGCLWAGSH